MNAMDYIRHREEKLFYKTEIIKTSNYCKKEEEEEGKHKTFSLSQKDIDKNKKI